jgi:hypothetical protein
VPHTQNSECSELEDGLEDRGEVTQWQAETKDYLLSDMARPTLRNNHPPIQYTPGFISS